MEMLTRTTQVSGQPVTLYSFDNVHWDSDPDQLQGWHREQERRGLSGAWHYERPTDESAARGRRRSVLTNRTRLRRKKFNSDNEQTPEEVDIDSELTALGGFRSLRRPISVEEEA